MRTVTIVLLWHLIACSLDIAASQQGRSGSRKVKSVQKSIPARQDVSSKKPRTKEGKIPGDDLPDEAEEYYRSKRSPDQKTPVGPEPYLEALRRMEDMPQYSSALGQPLPSRRGTPANPPGSREPSAGRWTELGPGNYGGRTRAFLVNPRTPEIMYAAGVAGGLWKSTDTGENWFPLTDLLPNLAVCSLTMNPENPDIIYAGTGEGYFNSSFVRGAGIFKTTDGGSTWRQLEQTRTADFYYVNDLVPSAHVPELLYAATRTGVWMSRDAGETWKRSLDPLNADGKTVVGGCLDLAIRTDRPTDVLFASCGTFERATVYRNSNPAESETWESVLSETDMGRTSLAVAPSDQNVVYAMAAGLAAGGVHALEAVFRSSDGGTTWEIKNHRSNPDKLSTVLLSNTLFAFGKECGQGTSRLTGQGWHDNVVAVDPTNPEIVWAGGIDLFRSDDAGATWRIASYWWKPGGFSPYVHADQHVIAFHPRYDGKTNQTMFVANDGGIFVTRNALTGTTSGDPCGNKVGTLAWKSLNRNYSVAQFYHGIGYRNGTAYFGGTQDNGTLLGSESQGNANWYKIWGGDGGYVASDSKNPDIIYAENTGLSILKSTNDGFSFQSAVKGIAEPSSNFPFIAVFVMDPNNSKRLWTGARAMWRTKNGAQSWKIASAPLTAENSPVTAIAVAPGDANLVLAGRADGFLHRTREGLTSDETTEWTKVRPTPSPARCSWLVFDPRDKKIAYATYSTFGVPHVWKSTNAGSTWTTIDGSGATGIPDIPVHCLVVNPNNSSHLFVGTDLGVFTSLDGGKNWAVENTGFPNVVTESLTLDGDWLFAFTRGRGAFRVRLLRPLGSRAGSDSESETGR